MKMPVSLQLLQYGMRLTAMPLHDATRDIILLNQQRLSDVEVKYEAFHDMFRAYDQRHDRAAECMILLAIKMIKMRLEWQNL